MLSFEDLMTRLTLSDSENVNGGGVSKILKLFIDKLFESYRFVTQGPPLLVHATLNGSCFLKFEVFALDSCSTKRCKERCLEEANQLLRQLSDESLRGLEETHIVMLVRLLLSMQLHTVSISTACRKTDQVSPPTRSARCPLHCNQKLTVSSTLFVRCCSVWQRSTTMWFMMKLSIVSVPSYRLSR